MKGYWKINNSIFNAHISTKINQFFTLTRFGLENCPVYLRISWIGKPSTNSGKRSQNRRGKLLWFRQHPLDLYVKTRAAFGPQRCFTYNSESFVIYKCKCHCDSRHVGRTSQRLQDHIKQHVPQWLRQQLTRPRRSQPHKSCKRNDTKPDCDSAIDQHLEDNDQCVLNYDNKRFSILATAPSSFHFNLLEQWFPNFLSHNPFF